ncbi:hypothetical protein GF312_15235 [Candidatus Poribacteria bacterium]|nr:hypothetical protein [Candidatus Poribacteria bacterium]
MKSSKLSKIISVTLTSISVLIIALLIYITFFGRDAENPGGVFSYNIDKYRKTDPKLIKFNETGSIDTGFLSVSAVTTDLKDQIYVAGDKAVRIFDSAGNLLSEFQLSDSANCMSVSEDDMIYLGIGDHVEVYNMDGKLLNTWKTAGEMSILTSVDAYGDDIFVADAGGRVVLRYDRSGKLIKRIAEPDEYNNIPGLVVPSPHVDLAVARDGLLRVVNPGNHRIEAYTFDGYLEFSWGEPSMTIEGFSGCCNPVNFAIMPNGRFVTCEQGLTRVKIYTEAGEFESVVAGVESFDMKEDMPIPDGRSESGSMVLDVAVDSIGRVLVLDPVQKSVRIFTEINTQESIKEEEI